MNGKPKCLRNWSILMLTAYTITYAIDCDLAMKQQQPDDIVIDSDVFPNPEQLPLI
jgi:hypothetical protein